VELVKSKVVAGLVAAVLALLVVGTIATPALAAPNQRTLHIVRAGDYELERVECRYRVTRRGQVLTSLDVRRCGDGVRLFVRGVPNA